jgi:hypothetical protein
MKIFPVKRGGEVDSSFCVGFCITPVKKKVRRSRLKTQREQQKIKAGRERREARERKGEDEKSTREREKPTRSVNNILHPQRPNQILQNFGRTGGRHGRYRHSREVLA